MLILPNSCFLHVPKTGGSWVKKAIIASGITYEEYRIEGDPHIGLTHCPVADTFKFAFVRHPVSLYRSYWQFKMTHQWDKKNPLDMECQSNDFNVFIQNVLAKFPSCYSHKLINFVGTEAEPIEFIGQYENLVEDLIRALTLAQETFSEDAIRDLPAYNVSNKKRFPADYDQDLEQKIRQSEHKMMKRFFYD